jgi:2-methylcitrate dehydratase
MGTAAEELSHFTASLKYEDLSEDVVHKAKQMLLDTLGCALGGYLNEPSRITRAVLREQGGCPESTIIGSGEKTSCANAALANCVMVRYLDFCDIYANLHPCHPSENIPTALAMGERAHATGRDILTAIVIGFEVQQRFADAVPIHRMGWHHVSIAGFTTPLVAGKLLNLDADQLAHAVGISGSHNLALDGLLGMHGHGQVTMMKAAGYGFGSQSGIIAALMAQKGFTGPHTIIESFNDTVFKGADLTPLIKGGEKMRILETSIKPFPCEFMIHSPLEALFTLVREHEIKAEDVVEMHLRTYEFAVTALAQLRAYKPETRETADHSLPYCLAIGLIEKEVGLDQFRRDQWKDPEILKLMSKIKVTADPELEKLFPKARPADLEIITTKGEKLRARVDYPKGDPRNPMTDQEVQAKFRKLTEPLMAKEQINRIIEAVNNVENINDTNELMELLVV